MPRDHIASDLRAAEALADTANDEIFGIGFTEFQARIVFLDLCRIYGFKGARAIMSEIMNAEKSDDDSLEQQILTDFRSLVRIVGFDNARAQLAEIILSEASRKRITIDG